MRSGRIKAASGFFAWHRGPHFFALPISRARPCASPRLRCLGVIFANRLLPPEKFDRHAVLHQARPIEAKGRMVEACPLDAVVTAPPCRAKPVQVQVCPACRNRGCRPIIGARSPAARASSSRLSRPRSQATRKVAMCCRWWGQFEISSSGISPSPGGQLKSPDRDRRPVFVPSR
jgi:hypothetical protein